MPRPVQRPARPANRPGQTRGGRRGQLEAFERQGQVTGAGTGTKEPVGIKEIPSVLTVADLAAALGVPVTQIIKTLVTNGIMATINQALDFETAAVVASDLGFEVKEQGTAPAPGVDVVPEVLPEILPEVESDGADIEDEATLTPRPPVVTIMGHVDHGKTSLLDAIRKTRVTASEAGGITQHIGAYQVNASGHTITFLDTPGHAAFTAMRARGAQVTDIAIIVVAADDGVMPQTREAIDHAKAAKVPIIVAINKVDLPNATPDRVKQELADINLVVTEFGGTTEAINVSARTGQGIDDLLETILLVTDAEVRPRANPVRTAAGAVVEARMDKARGPVATLLVQRGTLHIGDVLVAGGVFGKVKALYNDLGQRVKEAPPSYPVEVLGLSGVPAAGDRFYVVTEERLARAAVEAAQRGGQRDGDPELNMETIFARIRTGAVKELNLIVKADVQGSVEPLVSSLEKLGGDQLETRAKVISSGLGNVNVTDVNLAVASKALIIAFNVRIEGDARRSGQVSGVSIRDYSVIYAVMEDVEKMLTGMLAPRFHEVVHGHAEVRALFKAGRRTIAGCSVVDGTIHRRDRVRVLRAGAKLWEGAMDSLKRFKDDVGEVREGFECGVSLDGWDDLMEGDVLETFSIEQG